LLAILDQVSSQIPVGLANLTGFHWVDIADIICGHLRTAAVPAPPASDELSIARFCLGIEDLGLVVNASARVVLSNRPFRVGAVGECRLDRGVIWVPFAVSATPDVIRILQLKGRSIALTGMEKLYSLLRAGVQRALCLVSFGFGITALQAQPSIPWETLLGSRPPTMADLADDAMSCSVSVRPPLHLASFSGQVLQVSFPQV
jgi:hypothetical protein